MKNTVKEEIINSVFGENSAKLDSDAPDCRYFEYHGTKIYVVVDENQCALKLWPYPKKTVSLSLAKLVHSLFKNEANVKIAATLKQSVEEQRGTTFYPLSKDDFLLETNEIDWDKIASLTRFSMYFEETGFEKVKAYVEMFKQKIDEKLEKINEILSNNSDLGESSSDNSVSSLLEKIKDLMNEKIKQGETKLAYLALNPKYSCLQYGYGGTNSEIWLSSKCHYEFNETKRPRNIAICFHCEKNYGKNGGRELLADLLKKDNDLQTMLIDWQGLDGAGICYANISTKGNADEIAKNAVQKMLEFEGKYGSTIAELIQKSNDGSEIGHNEDKQMKKISDEAASLNTILYGPPGTGKTFNTMAYAISICEEKDVSEIKKEMQDDYGSVKKRYDALKDAGRIEFVTFHQSYGYEDFIEGIRPRVTNDGDDEDTTGLDYYLRPGIFKDFCEAAKDNFTNSIKMSSDKDAFDESWDFLISEINKSDDGKISVELKNKKTFLVGFNGNKTGLHAGGRRYFNKKQLRNIYEGQKGVPSGALDSYRRRIVEYMIKNCKLPKKDEKVNVNNDVNQKYVFIIDEINRGNISKIFGELITLIEPSKRMGQKESLTVNLPCSGDEFGVPDNVYILGTMNTADRSIAMMDTALRRRFSFVEMMPDTGDSSPLKGKVIGDIDICEMLKIINKRIEYLYDREHTIGHAFFIGIDDFDGLASVFRNKVIPLLQEYFYDDYEKIRLVLGDDGKSEEYQFVSRKLPENNLFKGRILDDGNDDQKYVYGINQIAFDSPESYKGII